MSGSSPMTCGGFPALPDACFARVFVLFPDPWPKKRHAERRFIGPENLPTLARLLKDGGELAHRHR